MSRLGSWRRRANEGRGRPAGGPAHRPGAAEKPVFHDPVSEKITAMAGHTISLNCSATGTRRPRCCGPCPTGRSCGAASGYTGSSTGGRPAARCGLSSEDAGAYRCVGLGAAGPQERLVSRRWAEARDEQAPPQPGQHVNGETLRLPCVPPGRPGTRHPDAAQRQVLMQRPQVRGRRPLGERHLTVGCLGHPTQPRGR